MLAKPLRAYLLLGLEPELDTAAGARALEVLAEARFVACVTPFVSEAMRGYAPCVVADGDLRRDLRQLRQRRGSLAELRGRSPAAG